MKTSTIAIAAGLLIGTASIASAGNKAAIVQQGYYNGAYTSQYSGYGSNKSLTLQYGGYNNAYTGQYGPSNRAGIGQSGYSNYSAVQQVSPGMP